MATQLSKWRRLPADLDWSPCQVGYFLCVEGEATLRGALTDLQHLMGGPDEGPRKIFGGLYDLLVADPCPVELQPFRAILQQHIRETWPFAPGDEVLGEPVLQRTLCSVRETACLLQRPDTEVITTLEAAGLEIPSRLPITWRIYDQDAAKGVLEQLNHGLTAAAFCKALSVASWVFAEMRDSGLLIEVAHGRWDPLAAQRLIDDLLVGAAPVYVGCMTGAAWRRPHQGCS